MAIQKWIAALLMTLLVSQVFADAVIDHHTQRLLTTGKTEHTIAELAKTFEKEGQTYIHVFIEGQATAIPALKALGVDINTVTDSGIMTAVAPLQTIVAVSKVNGIRRITAAQSVKKMMNVSTGPIGVNLPDTEFPRLGDTGQGVIVGVIDTGIDIGHPDFFDAQQNTRIAGIWDHTLDAADVNNMASAPAGFTYGTYWTQSQIQGGYGTCLSRDNDGHGTHVAGTAAGSGFAPVEGDSYTGVAPEATLYIVKFDFDNEKARNTETAILDGINWIFQQAEAANMPAVINMSLGSDYGPHDGSTAEERGMDDLTGPNKIVVVAAGNAGSIYGGTGFDTFGAPIHGAGNANTNFDIVLEMPPEYTANDANDYLFWDIWYDGADSMRVQITSPSGQKYPSNFKGPNRRLWTTNGQVGGFDTPEGLIYVANTSAADSFWGTDNGDNNLYIEISGGYGTPAASGQWIIELIPESGSGDYNAWHGSSAALRKTYLWYDSGTTAHTWGDTTSPWLSDSVMTIGKPASALSAISVGAYQTKNSWEARDYVDATDPLAGFSKVIQAYGVFPIDYYAPFVMEDLAFFSSRGPARDGRTQPTISAPGVGIVAALSQTVLNAAGDNYYRRLNRVEYSGFHAALQGTSMASPHVAGVTAILLEQANSLGLAPTPEDVRGYIQAGARADGYTGSVPNNNWGFGKVDTIGALAEIQVPDLSITTAALPSALQGVPYAESVQASGGQSPYSWSVSAGALPAGLSLDSGSGLITGTPTTLESAVFDVTVTDAANMTDTAGLSITVNSPDSGADPLISDISPSSGAAGDRLTLTIMGGNFQSGASVSLGDQVIVKQVSFVSAAQLQVSVSIKRRASTGAVDVTITNPDGGVVTAVNGFSIQ